MMALIVPSSAKSKGVFVTTHLIPVWLVLMTAVSQHAIGQTEPAPTPLIENERVKVWDITLTPGQPPPLERHENDFVTTFLVGGKIRTINANGKVSVAVRHFGDAVYSPKGTEEKTEVISASPARLVIVELKDRPEPPYVNNSGQPLAFPRPGSKKVLDNDRVVVWNYTWTPNVPTPTHFHDKDVVVVYRYDGSLKSTTPDGKSVVNDYKFATIRFNRGDRVHFEELVKGRQSAMMMELK
jgi:quercetin dioxygenase-like cupin family protein